MNQHAKLYTVLGLVFFLLFLGVLYFYPRTAPVPDVATSTLQTFVGDGFTFMHPRELTVAIDREDTQWSALASTPGTVYARVMLHDSVQPMTNFRDASFSIGVGEDANCETPRQEVAPTPVTINGVPFKKSVLADAGAGNLYETTVYRYQHNDSCYSIEYTIHTTNIGNYDPSQGINAYQKQPILDILEGMAQSFTFNS